jgi:hypothetical protein
MSNLALDPALAALAGGGDSAPPAGNNGPPETSITSKHSGDPIDDHITTAIEALQLAAEAEQDDQELLELHKAITSLQKILSGHSKNADAAMGVSPALKHVRRVSRRGRGAGAY